MEYIRDTPSYKEKTSQESPENLSNLDLKQLSSGKEF